MKQTRPSTRLSQAIGVGLRAVVMERDDGSHIVTQISAFVAWHPHGGLLTDLNRPLPESRGGNEPYFRIALRGRFGASSCRRLPTAEYVPTEKPFARSALQKKALIVGR